MKIVKCEIGPYPKKMFDDMPEVKVEMEDGTKKTLFSFYPDELSFSSGEFIGLTIGEANKLRLKKDQDYLRS